MASAEPDIAANAAMRIASDVQFLASMNNGQKHIIQKMQREMDVLRSMNNTPGKDHCAPTTDAYLQLLALIGESNFDNARNKLVTLQRKARGYDALMAAVVKSW